MDNAAAAIAVHVRTALRADVPALVNLTERRQERAVRSFPEHFDPVEEAGLAARLESVIEGFASGNVSGGVCLVAVRDGEDVAAYVLVSLATAPPVYAPGGPVGLVGSFIIADDTDEAAGRELLRTVVAYVRNLGAVCVVVPCAAGEVETAKAELLKNDGFYVASEWHSRLLDSVGYTATIPGHLVRPATTEDASHIAAAADQKRRLYETFAPVFWRNHPDGVANQTPFLAAQLAGDSVAGFVAPGQGASDDAPLDGYILVNKDGYVDDYAVAAPENWPTVGRALLDAATGATQKLTNAPRRMLVVCGQKDAPKHALLASQGYHVAENWWVRDLV